MSYEEIKHTQPKARKEYHCDWCREKILKGEKHHARTYKYEGDLHRDRMHNECFEALEKTDHDILESGPDIDWFKRGKPITEDEIYENAYCKNKN
jgi:hypothetical protein